MTYPLRENGELVDSSLVFDLGFKLTRYFYRPTERPDAVLQEQLELGQMWINELIFRPLELPQYVALICLASDLYVGLAHSPSTTFEDSFLVSAVNAGFNQLAAVEFAHFCYVENRVNVRAWNKRKAECYLFTRGKLLFS